MGSSFWCGTHWMVLILWIRRAEKPRKFHLHGWLSRERNFDGISCVRGSWRVFLVGLFWQSWRVVDGVKLSYHVSLWKSWCILSFLFFFAESNIQEVYFEPSQAEFCWLTTNYWSNSEKNWKHFHELLFWPLLYFCWLYIHSKSALERTVSY